MRAVGHRMKAGDQLPPLEIPITRTLVVAGAIASRDYQDVHHDAELARQKGSPDVFMNILTTNGLVGRYITDHFGPRAVLRKVAIRLGTPNYPGDSMVLTGTIEDVAEDVIEDVIDEVHGYTVTVRVVGANAIGRHVTGTVTITLPGKEPLDPEEANAAVRGGPGEPVEGEVSGARQPPREPEEAKELSEEAKELREDRQPPGERRHRPGEPGQPPGEPRFQPGEPRRAL